MWAGLELQNSSQLTKWRTRLPSAGSLRQASLLLGAPRQPAENQAAEQLIDDDREESDNEGDCLPSFSSFSFLWFVSLFSLSEIICVCTYIFPLPFRLLRYLYTCFKMERRFEIWTACEPGHSPETLIFTFSFIKRRKDVYLSSSFSFVSLTIYLF